MIKKEDYPNGGKTIVVDDRYEKELKLALQNILDARTLSAARKIAFDVLTRGNYENS